MASYGVTPEGFVRKRLDVILQEINDKTRSVFGQEIDLSPEAPDGQINGTIAEMVGNLWQLAEDVYLSFDPDFAQKHQLETIGKLNDIYRKLKTNTTAELTLTGDVGTIVPFCSQIALNDNPKIVFATVSNATIGAGGTIANVKAVCLTAGSIAVAANKIKQILTPIAGWNTANNTLAAATGQDDETDKEFRIRRAESTEKNASNMVEATWARLRLLNNIEDVRVYENDTNVTDSNGLPPHSIHVVVKGGDPVEIANTIWKSKSGGCSTQGDLSETIKPEQGGEQVIYYSQAIEVPIYVALTIKRLNGYTEESTAAIKQHIVDYAKANYKIGENVIYSRLYTPINQEPRHEIQSLFIGTAASPTGTVDIPISFKQLAQFSVDNIAITVNS